MGFGIKTRLENFLRFRNYRTWHDYAKHSGVGLRYIGWLGHRNIGDEALFSVFKKELCGRSLLLPFEDYSPLLKRLNFCEKRLVLLGGGTLINTDSFLFQMERAVEQGYQVAVFGTGVADMGFWTQHPGNGRGNSERWIAILQRALYVGVRGPRSLAWLRRNGIDNAEIVGDPALSGIRSIVMKPKSYRRTVGVNLGSHDPVSGGQENAFIALLQLTEHLIKNDYKVNYLSLNDIDYELGQAMGRSLGDDSFVIMPFSGHVETFLHQMEICDYVVGQRLHATVLSSAFGIPNISLTYQPKCLDFLESIGMEEYALPTETITGESLISGFSRLEEQADTIHHRLSQRCGEFRALQSHRAEQLGW